MSGRPRHLLVETTGLLLAVQVHAADIQDRDGAKLLLDGLAGRCPRLAKVWVEAAYQGPCATWSTDTLGWDVEVVRKPRRWVRMPTDQEPPPMPTGFPVLPRRGVVERTFAWLGRYRRLSKDYEVLPETEEAWISLAMSRLMTVRLAR